MKKILLTAAFISACLIFLPGSANANLLLCDIDEKGYKTYIDNDSISSRMDKEKKLSEYRCGLYVFFPTAQRFRTPLINTFMTNSRASFTCPTRRII